jgi:hypothetical protein
MFNDVTELPADLADPVTLLGATLYLMTRYTEAPCCKLAFAVTCHLEMLSAAASTAPRLRDLCDRLADNWMTLSRAAPKRPAEFARTALAPH